MKKTVLIMLAAVLCPLLRAQDNTEALRQLLEGSRVSFKYTLTVQEKVQVRTNGTALIDGEC